MLGIPDAPWGMISANRDSTGQRLAPPLKFRGFHLTGLIPGRRPATAGLLAGAAGWAGDSAPRAVRAAMPWASDRRPGDGSAPGRSRRGARAPGRRPAPLLRDRRRSTAYRWRTPAGRLRPDRRDPPPEPACQPPRTRPFRLRLSSLAIIGRRLPASSSFVLASALTGANGCGR